MEIKRIYNPLTIIAIFAGLAEIAGTVVIPLLSTDLQNIFIWYVMGFPILLVLLFFFTLNLNHKALYSPSDFSDENNFIKALFMKNKIVKDNEDTSEQIDLLKNDIEELKNSKDYKELADKLIKNIDGIKNKIEENQIDTYRLFDNAEQGKNSLHNKVLLYIHSKGFASLNDIATYFKITTKHAEFIISNLLAVNYVYSENKDGKKVFKELTF